MARSKATILTAGLEPRLTSWLEARLPGVRVESVHTGHEVLERSTRFAVVVLDGSLPSAHQLLKQLGRHPRVIYCSRHNGRPSTGHCVLFPPLDRERLAAEVAESLGITLPPRPEARKFRRAIPQANFDAETISRRLDALIEGVHLRPHRRTHEKVRALAEFLEGLGFDGGARVARKLEEQLRGDDHAHSISRRLLELCRTIHVPTPRRVRSDGEWPRLLVVEPDEAFAADLAAEAWARGLQPTLSRNLEGVHCAFLRVRPEAVVLCLPEKGDRWRKVQELLEAQPTLPTVVLANSISPEDVRQASRLQWKPVPASFVLDEVLMQLERVRTRPYSVLVVHPEKSVLRDYESLLACWDYHVTTCGEDGLCERLEECEADVLLLGHACCLSVCDRLRRDPRHVERSVIYLADSEESTLPGYRAGADECVRLPLSPAELLSRVGSHLQRTRARRSVSRFDPLTGLLRWPAARCDLERLLNIAARQGVAASIAVVRPDGFDRLVATSGRLEGNRRLQLIAATLHQTFRHEDVLARWADSSFLVGLYGMSRVDGVRRLSEVLGHLEVSAGLAQFPEDGTALQTLFLAACDAQERAAPGHFLPARGDGPSTAGGLKAELEVARLLQQSLLPQEPPQVGGWELAHKVAPARLVGGDLVQYFRTGACTGVALADVAGKGIPAALLVGGLQQIILHAVGRALSEAVAEINRRLYHFTPTEVSVAMVMALVEEHSGSVTICNAGCPRPLLYRHRSGGLEALDEGNLPLGWFPDVHLAPQEIRLRPGDTLLLHTDGLCDGFVRGSRERVGEARVRRALRRHGGRTVKELLRHLAGLSVCVGQPDDVGVALLRRTAAGRSAP